MRIGNPKMRYDGDQVVLEASVACESRTAGLPEQLWFRYPRQWASMINPGPEPMAIVLGPLASVLHESIEIDLPFSEQLHAGFEEYWTIFSHWFPKTYSAVKLHCPGHASPSSPHEATASAFSGGVDSFYTLFSKLESKPASNFDTVSNFDAGTAPLQPSIPSQPSMPAQLQYAMFIHGFDIPLRERRTYEVAAAVYESKLAEKGIRLIRVETNARRFVETANWKFAHGSVLCGSAQTLAAGIGQFVVPSSKSYATLAPWGSHPLIDPLLSSECLSIVHHGAACTRFEKLRAMRDWEFMRPLLRTCWKRHDGIRNCGDCRGCRQTMMLLETLGVLDQFETYPAVQSSRHFCQGYFESKHERLVGRQATRYAAQQGRRTLAWIGRYAVTVGLARRTWQDWKTMAREKTGLHKRKAA